MAVARHNDLGPSRHGTGQNLVIIRIGGDGGWNLGRRHNASQSRVTHQESARLYSRQREPASKFPTRENILQLSE